VKRLIFLFLSVILLAACAPPPSTQAQPTAQAFVTSTLPPTPVFMPTSNASSVTPTPATDPSIFAQLFPGANAGNKLTRMDQQGMIIVEITPINLGMPGDTLIFDVSMNTHSVDLNMDLAVLSILITDTGLEVQAALWDAPRGGHHVSGKLIFPAYKDGVFILEGATTFSLQVHNVDADLRTFEWPVQ